MGIENNNNGSGTVGGLVFGSGGDDDDDDNDDDDHAVATVSHDHVYPTLHTDTPGSLPIPREVACYSVLVAR